MFTRLTVIAAPAAIVPALLLLGSPTSLAAQDAASSESDTALAAARSRLVPFDELLVLDDCELLGMADTLSDTEDTEELPECPEFGVSGKSPEWTFRMDGSTRAGEASAAGAWIGGFHETDGACTDARTEQIRGQVHGDIAFESCLHGSGTLVTKFKGQCHEARFVEPFSVTGGRDGSDFVLIFYDYGPVAEENVHFPEKLVCLLQGPKEMAQITIALWGADGPQRTELRIPADRTVAWNEFDLGGMTAVLELTESLPLVPLAE